MHHQRNRWTLKVTRQQKKEREKHKGKEVIAVFEIRTAFAFPIWNWTRKKQIFFYFWALKRACRACGAFLSSPHYYNVSFLHLFIDSTPTSYVGISKCPSKKVPFHRYEKRERCESVPNLEFVWHHLVRKIGGRFEFFGWDTILFSTCERRKKGTE